MVIATGNGDSVGETGRNICLTVGSATPDQHLGGAGVDAGEEETAEEGEQDGLVAHGGVRFFATTEF
jgi:hypothetical protein